MRGSTFVDWALARRPARFPADASPAEVIARLGKALESSSFTLRSVPGLKGSASASYVYLTRQSQISSGGFKPHFVGKVSDDAGGAVLSGVYSLSWAFGVVFGAVVLAAAGWVAGGIGDWLAGAPLARAGHRTLVLAAVLAVAAIARRQAQGDMDWMSARLRQVIERPRGDLPPPAPPPGAAPARPEAAAARRAAGRRP